MRAQSMMLKKVTSGTAFTLTILAFGNFLSAVEAEEAPGKDGLPGNAGRAGQSHRVGTATTSIQVSSRPISSTHAPSAHPTSAYTISAHTKNSSTDPWSSSPSDKSLITKSEPKDPLSKAKAIIRELESVEHPETRVVVGSPGWSEERQAAMHSSQQRIQSCQDRLNALGIVITPVLVTNLSSTNHDVAQVCSTVLGQFGVAAVPALVEVIKKDGPQPMAMAALKLIGPDALPPIAEMVQSSDNAQSLAAIVVISSFLPDFQMVGFHQRYFHYNRVQNPEFVLPLPLVNQLCHLSTKDKTVKYREQLVVLLGKIGPRSQLVADTVMTFVTEDEQPIVREAAVASLGHIATRQSEEPARKSIASIITVLKKDDFEGCRAEAATVLGMVPNFPDLCVPALTDAFKDGYTEVSSAALQSLGNFGERSASALPVLMKVIQEKPDSNEACSAMQALARMKSGCAPALPLIVSNIQSHSQQMQTAALTAVETLGPLAAPAVKPLIDLMLHSDNANEYQVIRALGAIGPQAKEAVPQLREMVKRGNNQKQWVRQALVKITGSDESVVDSAQVAPAPATVSPSPNQSAPIIIRIPSSSI